MPLGATSGGRATRTAFLATTGPGMGVHGRSTALQPRAAWETPSRRSMSTAAAADQELDDALDSILGEALAEAENPAAGAGEGHIEGSHPFPKELVEEVRSWRCRLMCVCVAEK